MKSATDLKGRLVASSGVSWSQHMLPTVFITIHDDVGDLWGIFWRDLFASGRSKVRSRVGGGHRRVPRWGRTTNMTRTEPVAIGPGVTMSPFDH